MEEWSHWHPIAHIDGKFFIEDFHMSYKGIEIKLCSAKKDKKIEILFFNGADAYKCTNESWAFDIFAILTKKHGDDFYANWSFFKIINSNYAKSLSLTSCGLSNDTNFDHFCIVGNDEIIDILARYEPTVKILTAK
ncbi:hypothetical protein KBD08_01615 [Candidatus Babeliales bacterium]|nr:hypothetical protein [Candidatus Babeliales bacterium]